MSSVEAQGTTEGLGTRSRQDQPTTALGPADPAYACKQDLEIPRRLHANGWRLWHLLLMIALIGFSGYVMREGWADWYWLAMNDVESSHILFVVPIVLLWLLWIRRYRLLEVTPQFSLLGPLFILLAWGVWEYGYYENIRVFGHIAAISAALGALLTVTGDRLLWKLLAVFGVLAFAVPVPHSVRTPISMPLQRVTARIAEHVINLFGVEITRAGSVLTINGVEVGVAEACNGMRMVFALVLVTYLFAFSSRLRPGMRLLVLVLCPVLALVCNVIRLIPSVYLYGYAPETAAKAFHDFSGWFMLGVALLLMIGALKLMRWVLADDSRGDRPTSPPPDAARRSPASSPRPATETS